jgi:hypothetical protein
MSFRSLGDNIPLPIWQQLDKFESEAKKVLKISSINKLHSY